MFRRILRVVQVLCVCVAIVVLVARVGYIFNAYIPMFKSNIATPQSSSSLSFAKIQMYYSTEPRGITSIPAITTSQTPTDTPTQPGGGTPQPGGGTPQPGGSTPQPGGSTPQPGGSTPQPGGGGSPQPLGVGGNWKSIFDEEWNGTSIDSSKWHVGWGGNSQLTGPVNGAETACYNANQATLPGDGSLHLGLIQQNCNGKPYTGALIDTNGKFQFTYGFVEFRAYLPGANGKIYNWPALWSDGQNWPYDGEIDTLEALGNGQACFHFHYPGGGPGGCANGDFSGWHTFAVNWEPGNITYYYDGQQVGQITSGVTSSPLYLILNNSTSSESVVSAPADVRIDYVRVWQQG